MQFKKMIYMFIILITISSILLVPHDYPYLLILAALGTMFILHFEKQSLKINGLRLLSLSIFHAMVQLDWSILLYIVICIQDFLKFKNIQKSKLWFSSYATSYCLIMFTYHPFEMKTILFLCYTITVFLVAFQLCSKLLHSEKETKLMSEKNVYLSKHDPLTGLTNFQEFHQQLHTLIQNKSPLILVFIDCTNLKSMNNQKGFQGGNELLMHTAGLLKIVFPNAYIVSRYGGDEFAIAIKSDDHVDTLKHLDFTINTELPKLIGIPITYGYAEYPDDGIEKDDLIHKAESQLYLMKRKKWLQREEHMFRSEKLKIVGELASGLAHEIRNPLTSVKGFLQISKEHKYNIEPWYELIMGEIKRMSELTAEFLQFSKPHSSRYRASDIHVCIQRVIHLMESEAARLGHQIKYIPYQTPLYINMDDDKIVQMLLNLVKNAFEAMQDNGTVTIHVNSPAPHHDAYIKIYDNGDGIPESELHKIFHPFYTTKEQGTGLGLSICHKVVQDHQGVLEIESILNQGTTFNITFPIVKRTPSSS